MEVEHRDKGGGEHALALLLGTADKRRNYPKQINRQDAPCPMQRNILHESSSLHRSGKDKQRTTRDPKQCKDYCGTCMEHRTAEIIILVRGRDKRT